MVVIIVGTVDQEEIMLTGVWGKVIPYTMEEREEALDMARTVAVDKRMDHDMDFTVLGLKFEPLPLVFRF